MPSGAWMAVTAQARSRFSPNRSRPSARTPSLIAVDRIRWRSRTRSGPSSKYIRKASRIPSIKEMAGVNGFSGSSS